MFIPGSVLFVVFSLGATVVYGSFGTCFTGWNAISSDSHFCTVDVSTCSVQAITLPSQGDILVAYTFHETHGTVAHAVNLSTAKNVDLVMTLPEEITWKNRISNVSTGISLKGGYLVSNSSLGSTAFSNVRYLTVRVVYTIRQRPVEFSNVFSIGPGGSAGDHGDVVAITVVDIGDTVWFFRNFNSTWSVRHQNPAIFTYSWPSKIASIDDRRFVIGLNVLCPTGPTSCATFDSAGQTGTAFMGDVDSVIVWNSTVSVNTTGVPFHLYPVKDGLCDLDLCGDGIRNDIEECDSVPNCTSTCTCGAGTTPVMMGNVCNPLAVSTSSSSSPLQSPLASSTPTSSAPTETSSQRLRQCAGVNSSTMVEIEIENITDVNVIALREEIAVLLGIPLDCVVIVGTEGSSVGVIVVVIINDHQIAIELIDIINNEWCRKPNNSGPGR